MAHVTAACGCEIEADIVGGCFGFHNDGDYCECPEPWLESASLVEPCDEHKSLYSSVEHYSIGD